MPLVHGGVLDSHGQPLILSRAVLLQGAAVAVTAHTPEAGKGCDLTEQPQNPDEEALRARIREA